MWVSEDSRVDVLSSSRRRTAELMTSQDSRVGDVTGQPSSCRYRTAVLTSQDSIVGDVTGQQSGRRKT